MGRCPRSARAPQCPRGRPGAVPPRPPRRRRKKTGAAAESAWSVDHGHYAKLVYGADQSAVLCGGCWGGEASVSSTADALHIVRHDPASVLAVVEAKRAAISHHKKLRPFAELERREEYILAEGAGAVVIKMLALPYADHPGYRDDWRP
ncbi:DUF6221 family protein (plasmid) [Streptomyces sp. NBC_01717]|uniref:DUF6221 family protein n=1 Tax=Streptomyces sp. NBC_01717 TaxID=2975918 RepID=UPI002E31A503|nr:DUF6221 family protein [Streptomyces sp. NBC_01717]